MHHLDDAGDAGGGLGVADVGLDRAEPQRAVVAVLAVGGEQGLGLDRVAERGAGAVGLDRVDVAGREAGVGEGLADHPLLGGAVGRGEAVAGAVLVDRGAADHGEDGVRRCARRRRAARAGAGRRPRDQPVPSAAAAKDLQRPSGARPRWRVNSTKAPGVAITVTPPARARAHSPPRSAWHGEVHRDQRGGAGGVDGDRRALAGRGCRRSGRRRRCSALPVPR